MQRSIRETTLQLCYRCRHRSVFECAESFACADWLWSFRAEYCVLFMQYVYIILVKFFLSLALEQKIVSWVTVFIYIKLHFSLLIWKWCREQPNSHQIFWLFDMIVQINVNTKMRCRLEAIIESNIIPKPFFFPLFASHDWTAHGYNITVLISSIKWTYKGKCHTYFRTRHANYRKCCTA